MRSERGAAVAGRPLQQQPCNVLKKCFGLRQSDQFTTRMMACYVDAVVTLNYLLTNRARVCMQFTGWQRIYQNERSLYRLVRQRHHEQPKICGLLVVLLSQSGSHNGGYWRRYQINRKWLIDG